MESVEEINTCCAASYSHPLARWIMGDTMHPGGAALTARLANLMGVNRGTGVLDIGSGRGASAVHLAKRFGCTVTGVTLERNGTQAGVDLAAREGVQERCRFIQGDYLDVELPGTYDAAISECVLSILQLKHQALARTHGLLRPGGLLGLTDVTVDGAIPDDLAGLLGKVGCVGSALSLQEYEELVSQAGFRVKSSHNLPDVATGFLQSIKGKLLMAEVAAGLGKVQLDAWLLPEAKRVIGLLRGLVEEGVLSYGMVVARKPA